MIGRVWLVGIVEQADEIISRPLVLETLRRIDWIKSGLWLLTRPLSTRFKVASADALRRNRARRVDGSCCERRASHTSFLLLLLFSSFRGGMYRPIEPTSRGSVW